MKITIEIADAQQIAKLCAIDLAPIRAEAEKTYPVPKSWANLQPNGKPSAKASPGPKGGAAGAASGRREIHAEGLCFRCWHRSFGTFTPHKHPHDKRGRTHAVPTLQQN